VLRLRGTISAPGLAAARIRRTVPAEPEPGPAGHAQATVVAIDHPNGTGDVVLRLEEGGGFAPMEMTAAQAPTFGLYGDGVIVRD
jgi:hypothetical protein